MGDSSYGNGAVARHWNGHSWKQTITPSRAAPSVLLGVIIIPSSGRAWAVGNTNHATLMLHWSGTAWQ